LFALSLLTALLASPARTAEPAVTEVRVDPAAVRLTGPGARYSLLVHGRRDDGRLVDLTRDARFQSRNPKVAGVPAAGVVHAGVARAAADGATEVRVTAAGRTLSVAVTVKESARSRKFNFENDLIPLFSRFGCNSSGCHGKAEGQNGFKLSVFGFDPPADYGALTKESRGRRVFVAAPEHSLLLTKICGTVAHGGGVRLPRTSPDYETPPRSVA